MIDPNIHTMSAPALARSSAEDRTAGRAPGREADAASFDRLVRQSAETTADTAENKNGSGFIGFIKAFIDIINPLQHIPVVGAIYRQMTGDEISPVARIAGDALYGGPIGAAVGVADVVTEKNTGKDIGGNMLAMFQGDQKNAPVQIADAAPKTIPLSDIVWLTPPSGTAVLAQADIQSFPSSHPPTPSYRTGMSEKEPVTHSYTSPSSANPAQEPPDGTDRKAVPPERIAAEMMSALDKYAAMQRARTQPAVSVSF